LKHLGLSGTAVKDDTLGSVAELTGAGDPVAGRHQGTDVGVRKLAPLKKVRVLNLRHSASGQLLDALKGMDGLTELYSAHGTGRR